ncbi:lipopolysaccharide biosynthesis protein [Bacteroides sp. AN502(2024)]|uniref:lipopolysaccharide biosynthesis protein n=1 Tax=Bacteroides sp. AN502(2024) TaxID=3160599 RepID=UPI0035140115
MRNKSAYIWGILGKIGPQGINLIINMILARFLTPDDFGKIGVLAVFITVSMTLSESGLGGSLIKEDNISKKDCQTVFTFNLGISIFFYILLFLCAYPIQYFFNIPRLENVVRSLALVFILSAICIVPKSIMIRELRFKELTIISIISYVIGGIVAITGCLFNWGVYALVAFQLSLVATTSILTNYFAKYHISIGFNYHSFKRLFSFGAFTTLCNIIDSFYENIISILFGKFAGLSIVGYYDQAKKIETGSANSIVTTVNLVSFPILARLRTDKIAFKYEADSIFKYLLQYLVPILCIISIYSKEIIVILWGRNWIDAAPILSILMLNGIVFLCESLVRNNIKSLGSVKFLANITIIKRFIGIGIICSFLFISDFALLYGLVVSTLLGFVMNVWLYCRIMCISFVKQLSMYFQYLLPPVLLSGVCFVIYSYSPYNLIYNIIICAVLLCTYYGFIYRYMKRV